MGRRFGVICLIILFAVSLAAPVQAAREELIYIIPLSGEVDGALPSTIRRALNEADRAEATVIILEINTYGGRVDSADEIRKLIEDSPVPVYAHVRNAISAGAFIALACDRIYMNTGSALGAVEPRTADGQPVDEKEFSVIEGQMRSMAERNSRDPEIAEAMVRKEKAIEGVVDSGKLLTLTPSRALELGYAEAVVGSRGELLNLLGHGEGRVAEFTESWADRLARFVTSTAFSSIILAIGFAGLVIEVFTAGFGVAGTISLVAFTLFFGGHLLAGFAQWEYIAVFIVGIILLISEIFVAGFGFLGAAGLIFVAFSIILTAETLTQGLKMLGIALVLAIAIIAVAFRFLTKSNVWKRLVLSESETKERGYVGPKSRQELLNKEGVAITPLRPSGTVQLSDGTRVDAMTEGNYLGKGTAVKIVGYSSDTAIVSDQIEKE